MRTALLAGLLSAALPASAGKLPAGDFLNIPVDVRALGMGEAATAAAEGAAEVSVNPAALGQVRTNQVYFTHAFLLSGIGGDYLSYGGAFGPHHFGFSLQHVGYGSLQGADDAGNQTTGFGPADTAYGFSYATGLKGAQVGASLKYIDSKIVNSARTVGFDLGGRYAIGEEWEAGLAALNLGGGLNYETESFPLPARVAAGGGWRPQKDWRLTLDLVAPWYTPTYLAMGTEYVMAVKGAARLSLRAGINTKTPELGALAGFKAGLGFAFRDLEADFALDPAGELGQSLHFGLGWRFGWPGAASR